MTTGLVIEVFNDDGTPFTTYGMIGDTIFPSYDASLSETNGWVRLRMSTGAWQRFHQAHHQRAGGPGVVLEIVDNETFAPLFHFGLLDGTVFAAQDGSLVEWYGWKRVTFTERNWQKFYGNYILKGRLDLVGQPIPLNPDGTIKSA